MFKTKNDLSEALTASIRPHGSTTTCTLTVCAFFFPE